MKKLVFNIKPSEDDINEIMNWLKNERESLEEWFYCNRRVINSSFEENQFIAFQIWWKNIWFAVWSISWKKWMIDIFEISPDYRKKWLWKKFWRQCLHFLKEKGCHNIELECVPTNSQFFWKKLWFIDIENQSEEKIILSVDLNLI